MARCSFLLLAAAVALASAAGPRQILSPVFGDGMVLQRAPAQSMLFGRSGSAVEVFVDGLQVATATPDQRGRWFARLPAFAGSAEEHSVTVTSGDAKESLEGVLFGDVFLCAGDAAMAQGSASVQAAHDSSLLRLASARVEAHPANRRMSLQWRKDSNSADFPALCYSVGLEALSAGVPVGLIDASVSGEGPLSTCGCSPSVGMAYHAALRPLLRLERAASVWRHSSASNASSCHAVCVQRAFAGDRNLANPWLAGAIGPVVVPAAHAESVQSGSENPYIRKPGEAPLIIGHRGSAATAPENTIVSQEAARRGGATWIEDDTQPSKDHIPFVLHDGTVDRTTDGKGEIRKMTSAQLKALDAGKWFAPSYAGTRLPTLEEQLTDLHERGGNLLLEIKGTHSREEVARVVALVRSTGMADRVIIQSFDDSSIQYAAAEAPEIPRMLLRSGIEADPVAVALKLGACGYNPDTASLIARPDAIPALHAANISVFAWTPDTPALWQQMWDMGVDGWITNKAIELHGWVEGRQQEQQQAGANAAGPMAHHHMHWHRGGVRAVVLAVGADAEGLPHFVKAVRDSDDVRVAAHNALAALRS